MYLNRNIEKRIIDASKEFASIMIYGPRQAGKLTLLCNVFPSFKYVSLDEIEIREYAIQNPKSFLKYYGTPLIIDEVQKVPDLFEYIKIEIDKLKKECVFSNKPIELLYVLSGSNRYELEKNVSESLAGRTCVFDISSLSYNEIKKRDSFHRFDPEIDVLREREKSLKGEYRSRRKIFEDIFKGGMPEYVLDLKDREMFFKSYIQTYIERDVKKNISPDKEITFRNFMKYVALRTACQVDYAEISRSVGIDARTVKGWLSILETSGIIKLIEPYMSNVSDRIVKSSKMYFMDTGLCSYLCGIPSAETLEKSTFAGAFYETYVISEIIKSYYNDYKDVSNLYYYRDRDRYEVDLIIDSFDSIYPIEIKKDINPVSYNKRFDCLKKYKKRIATGLVIASTGSVFPINDEVCYCPIDLIGL